MNISELFRISVAKSKSTEDYDAGEIPFVTNTILNNGVVAYVTPFEDDKVFDGPAICISGLGHATVHLTLFLPKGNGGDSATILKPIADMTTEELIYYAAIFNVTHSWRFTFGRKASKRRIEGLNMYPLYEEIEFNCDQILKGYSVIMREHIQHYEDNALHQ